LIVHNFTVYDIKRKQGYYFFWNESRGDLSANEFSSIITYFLQKFVIEQTKNSEVDIILFSNGWAFKNCNATLSNTLLNLSILFGVAITQKFLLGHTQMDVDCMHSTIEK